MRPRRFMRNHWFATAILILAVLEVTATSADADTGRSGPGAATRGSAWGKSCTLTLNGQQNDAESTELRLVDFDNSVEKRVNIGDDVSLFSAKLLQAEFPENTRSSLLIQTSEDAEPLVMYTPVSMYFLNRVDIQKHEELPNTLKLKFVGQAVRDLYIQAEYIIDLDKGLAQMTKIERDEEVTALSRNSSWYGTSGYSARISEDRKSISFDGSAHYKDFNDTAWEENVEKRLEVTVDKIAPNLFEDEIIVEFGGVVGGDPKLEYLEPSVGSYWNNSNDKLKIEMWFLTSQGRAFRTEYRFYRDERESEEVLSETQIGLSHNGRLLPVTAFEFRNGNYSPDLLR